VVTHDRGEAMALGDRVAVMIDGRILQIDAASRVFRSPASEEVARFVGVETIADARVVSADGGRLTLDMSGQKVEVAGRSGRPGDHVRVCVRPEDVTVGMPGDVVLSGGPNQLTGIISGLSPAGAQVRVTVDCGFPLVARIAPRSVDERALAAGMPVVASFPASAAHIIAPP
jgi:ABC-type Fe3+/spermidine/putrescine transport system ATPase subunit